MMFKEYVQHDITSSFINLNEFASEVVINSVPVKVVEDKDQLLYRIKKNYDGLIVGDILFFISAEEYGKIPNVSKIPSVNEAINYNGRPCLITDVNSQEGLYEITLQRTGGY